MLGPSGHSERADEWAERDYDMNYTTLAKQARYLTVHFYYCTFLNAQIIGCVWMALEKIGESLTGRTLCCPVSVAVQTHTLAQFVKMSDMQANCGTTWVFNHKQDGFATFILIILEVHHTVILIFV